jgi:hypothetical protein
MNKVGGLDSTRVILSAVLAVIILDLILIQPNHPAAVAWDALLLFPIELPVILLALVALGQSRAGWIFRLLLVTILSCIAIQKCADFLMFTSLNRGFNIVADLPLVSSLINLIVGTLGQAYAFLAIIGSIIATLIIVALLWWACGIWSNLHWPKSARAIALITASIGAGFVAADVGAKMNRWTIPFDYPGTAFTTRVGIERIETAKQTISDLRSFRKIVKTDAFSKRTDLYDMVDRDVLIVFVESYGRTSLDTPFYADTHRETLKKAQTQLSELGLEMSSTLLASPTEGGQSWLAHSSFANGLWIDNQSRYGAALTSGRQSLFHIAADAGFRTAAIMPQITLDWPESQFMGFDIVLAEKDLGYAGKPFNWITMPDQFTFAAMDRLLRNRDEDTPALFIQMALGSSHAPWVPVPDLIAWEEIEDGTVFNPIVEASDPPSVVWQDTDRVRRQYRKAVDYALQTAFAYAALHSDDPPLMLIIGDHQAANFIALDDRPHVPMHIIGPKHLVDLLSDSGFQPGLIPSGATPVRRMDTMREHLLQSLSSKLIAEKPQ